MKKWSHVVVVFCLVLFALVWSASIVPTLPNTSTAIVAQAAKVSLNITSKRIIKGKSFTLKVKGTTKIVVCRMMKHMITMQNTVCMFLPIR